MNDVVLQVIEEAENKINDEINYLDKEMGFTWEEGWVIENSVMDETEGGETFIPLQTKDVKDEDYPIKRAKVLLGEYEFFYSLEDFMESYDDRFEDWKEEKK